MQILLDTLSNPAGEEVQIFLFRDAASCIKAKQKVLSGYYNDGRVSSLPSLCEARNIARDR